MRNFLPHEFNTQDCIEKILKVPSLDQCFRVPRLDLMRSTLIDIKDIGSTEEEEINAESLKVVEIEEVLLVRLGIDETRQDCYLFVSWKGL